MRIQSSFWIKLRRFCAQHLANDDQLRLQVDAMIDRISESAHGEQQTMMTGLFSTLGRMRNAAELGLQIGGRMPVTAYGVLCLGVLTAPTIRDALRFVSDAQHVETPLINMSYSETSSEGSLTIGFRCLIDGAGEALIVAMCIAAIECEIARRSGRNGNLARLELTSSSRGSEASYRKLLSLTPHTDGQSNKLVFSRAILDMPNPGGDIDTFNSVLKASMEGTELRGSRASLQQQVREVIMSGIGAPPSQDRLAKLLGLTPRQLRLRLDREGTSYQTIIRDCRTEYASALFKNPLMSLSQIAERLGYSDLSAFSHSFYRWTGKSPSTFRGEILSGDASC